MDEKPFEKGTYVILQAKTERASTVLDVCRSWFEVIEDKGTTVVLCSMYAKQMLEISKNNDLDFNIKVRNISFEDEQEEEDY